MNPRNVIIIPPTLPNQPSRYLGTPGKTHVIGYARVEKGTGAGVQIRKNIKQLIAEQPEWELVYVTTDYYKTQNQDLTYRSFFNICKMIRSGCVDVLIIYSANNWEEDYSVAEWLFQLCGECGIQDAIIGGLTMMDNQEFPNGFALTNLAYNSSYNSVKKQRKHKR